MSDSLRRAFDAAAGQPADFCTTCWGPSARAPRLVLLEGGEELGECEACGRPVAPDGRSICRPGGGGIKVIHLEDAPDDFTD